ncbi:MAG: FMN-binding negative transcriptional regulator [Hyphomicrobiaceae bacterium]
MLYTPPAFRVDDLPLLLDHIARTGLATFITTGADGPIVSHVPLVHEPADTGLGRLIGHLARANPQRQETDLSKPALAVFMGPDAYISPSWHPSKAEAGRVVPTWNYAVVHVRGALSFFDDAAKLRDAVERLTDHHERTRADRWQVSDAPERYVASQLKGIVGFEIAVASIEGKYKLSQNRSEPDREGVIAGLAQEGDAGSLATRALMRPAEKS